jgi:hypothetical protein
MGHASCEAIQPPFTATTLGVKKAGQGKALTGWMDARHALVALSVYSADAFAWRLSALFVAKPQVWPK